MSRNTFLEYMYTFCRAMIAVFEKLYLGEPTVDDTSRLLSINEARDLQERCRADIWCASISVAIVRHPARMWSLKIIYEVMTFCVIMHNMLIET
jgi:hypothetical protein